MEAKIFLVIRQLHRVLAQLRKHDYVSLVGRKERLDRQDKSANE